MALPVSLPTPFPTLSARRRVWPSLSLAARRALPCGPCSHGPRVRQSTDLPWPAPPAVPTPVLPLVPYLVQDALASATQAAAIDCEDFPLLASCTCFFLVLTFLPELLRSCWDLGCWGLCPLPRASLSPSGPQGSGFPFSIRPPGSVLLQLCPLMGGWSSSTRLLGDLPVLEL